MADNIYHASFPAKPDGTFSEVEIKLTAPVTVVGTMALDGSFGAFGASPVGRQTVTGSRADGSALASLLTALATLGWITDSSS
jgi:hypothetical protein